MSSTEFVFRPPHWNNYPAPQNAIYIALGNRFITAFDAASAARANQVSAATNLIGDAGAASPASFSLRIATSDITAALSDVAPRVAPSLVRDAVAEASVNQVFATLAVIAEGGAGAEATPALTLLQGDLGATLAAVAPRIGLALARDAGTESTSSALIGLFALKPDLGTLSALPPTVRLALGTDAAAGSPFTGSVTPRALDAFLESAAELAIAVHVLVADAGTATGWAGSLRLATHDSALGGTANSLRATAFIATDSAAFAPSLLTVHITLALASDGAVLATRLHPLRLSASLLGTDGGAEVSIDQIRARVGLLTGTGMASPTAFPLAARIFSAVPGSVAETIIHQSGLFRLMTDAGAALGSVPRLNWRSSVFDASSSLSETPVRSVAHLGFRADAATEQDRSLSQTARMTGLDPATANAAQQIRAQLALPFDNGHGTANIARQSAALTATASGAASGVAPQITIGSFDPLVSRDGRLAIRALVSVVDAAALNTSRRPRVTITAGTAIVGYFAPTYFAPTYFAPTYFPDDTGLAGAVTPLFRRLPGSGRVGSRPNEP